MFIDFFYALRKKKVPVSFTEWMTLMETLAKGYIRDLDEFYYLARSILVKSEAYFDHYDMAFQQYFKGVDSIEEITDQILDWLKDPIIRQRLDLEQLAKQNNLTLDELIKQLEDRIRTQKEVHDGGNKWIGRGGTSPFGTRKPMPVYVERTVLDIPKIYVNGGRRGYLVGISPTDLVRILDPELVEVAVSPTTD